MSHVGEDGISKREHLEADARGFFPNPVSISKLENEPELPALVSDMWVSFLALHLRRGRDMDGPLRFTWSEIQAYCNLTGARFSEWQLRVLFLLEDEYFAVRAENKPNTPTKPTDKSGAKEL
jgi:hypothetical protein